MKLLFFAVVALVSVSLSVWAESPKVHFRGILDLGASRLFSLATDGGTETAWVSEGESFAGYRVKEFKPAENTLILHKDGEDYSLSLAGGRVLAEENTEQPHASAIDDATRLLQDMQFEEMLAFALEQQKEAMANFSRQMMQQMGQEVDEEAIALQMRILDIVNEEINWPGLQEEVAQLYGETFTTDELRGLIDFYSTPAGQAFIEKQPELNMGMMEIFQPRLMQAMPKVQQVIQETMSERGERETNRPE